MKKISLLLIIFALLIVPSSGQLKDSNLFVVVVNGKAGFIDRTGKIVIQPQWDSTSDFSEGLAGVANYENGLKVGYIDKTGKIVIPFQFDRASGFSEGLAAVGFGEFGLHNTGNHTTGFIDKTGKLVIEAKFTDADDFSEGLALVYHNEKYGFIDRTGKIIIPLKFDDANSFSEGLACVKIGENFGFIDKTGRIVIKPEYSFPSVFKEGLAYVEIGGKYSPHLRSVKGIVYELEEQGKPMFIDKTGRVVIKFKDNVVSSESFSEGLAKIEVQTDAELTHKGFIDKSGKVVIKPKSYQAVYSFSDGLAGVWLENGKRGYINRKGKIVFLTDYDIASDFKNGLAEVHKEIGKNNISERIIGYIDKTGKVIWNLSK